MNPDIIFLKPLRDQGDWVSDAVQTVRLYDLIKWKAV